MERIIGVGQYEFYVKYRQESRETPILYEIHAFTDVVLFDHTMPIMFEKHEHIPLGTASIMTLEMAGKISLEHALIESLLKIPKSSGILKIVP